MVTGQGGIPGRTFACLELKNEASLHAYSTTSGHKHCRRCTRFPPWVSEFDSRVTLYSPSNESGDPMSKQVIDDARSAYSAWKESQAGSYVERVLADAIVRDILPALIHAAEHRPKPIGFE